jgi:hypothetical protein
MRRAYFLAGGEEAGGAEREGAVPVAGGWGAKPYLLKIGT